MSDPMKTLTTTVESLRYGFTPEKQVKFFKKYVPWLTKELQETFPDLSPECEEVAEETVKRIINRNVILITKYGQGQFRELLNCWGRAQMKKCVDAWIRSFKQMGVEGSLLDRYLKVAARYSKQTMPIDALSNSKKAELSRVLKMIVTQNIVADEEIKPECRAIAKLMMKGDPDIKKMLKATNGKLSEKAVFAVVKKLAREIDKKALRLWKDMNGSVDIWSRLK